MGSQQIDIVMLPFMAHGHLIPFLSLATQIHHRTGFNIAIANTPLNIQYLRSTFHQHQHPPPWIHLFELPFNSAGHGLPPNSENTENLPLDQIGKLVISSVSLKTPFHNFLLDIIKKQGKPPLCIISDVFFGWVVEVANIMNTVSITFDTGGAYGILALFSFWLNLSDRKTDSEEFNLPGFPERCKFHVSQLHEFMRNADGNDSWSRFLKPQLSSSLQSFGCLTNTAEELEPLGLDSLRKYTQFPVWPIGPLLPKQLLNKSPLSSSSSTTQHAGKSSGISAEKFLYISFGSQNTVSRSQMMELAIGLEKSWKPLIWVIRPPLGFDLKAEFRSEWLPEGFEARMKESNQGLLVKNWALQLEILSHKSTGAFLSHCGWNSIMESLSQGVKIIGWPMAAEQAFNSKMLVDEMGVSVELTRGVQSSISRTREKLEEIAHHIREAVKDEGSEKGSSIKAKDDFISAIKTRKQEVFTSSILDLSANKHCVVV
ncbi:hypothetical protein ES288_A11G235800v1 [Gossypium darwinii]|uniref:Glycosyltransferase N-terminal domain-containing protein n=1 Tax=Gossypium darwinii TaxID=34276 RepID=A0A5D2EPL3_GOSDA|nr:hypothetical protein ES288_A11G235800v1 [Gossypium darwinii]